MAYECSNTIIVCIIKAKFQFEVMLPSHHSPVRFINKSNKSLEFKMITNKRKNR